MRCFEKRSDEKRQGAFLLDWLEFSYLPGGREDGLQLWTDFMDDFPEFEDEFAETVLYEKGMHGYTYVYKFTDQYSILYNPDNADMGVHVIFPSHGLPKLCQLFDLGSDNVNEYAPAQKMFQILNERSCKVTRMDVCYDDYSKLFTPNDFNILMSSGRILTKCREYRFFSSYQTCGSTFYLGKRGRDRLFRCYDKNIESNGVIDAVRYELELRGDYAKTLQRDIAEGKRFKFSEMLTNMFNVVNEYEQNDGASSGAIRMRKSMAGLDPKWLELLNLFDKLVLSDNDKLVIDRVERVPSWTRFFNWFEKQILKNLYMFREVIGSDEKLIDMIDFQEGRLSEMKEKMLGRYKQDYKQINGWYDAFVKKMEEERLKQESNV